MALMAFYDQYVIVACFLLVVTSYHNHISLFSRCVSLQIRYVSLMNANSRC